MVGRCGDSAGVADMASVANEGTASPNLVARSWAQGLLWHLPLFFLPAFAVVVFSLVAWASIVHGISVEALTRDMATLARFPPYVSVASSLGAFVMCATATCCLFAYFVAREAAGEPQQHILAVGLFSLYLMVDDFYEFHDRVLPQELGVPQWLVYASIATAAAAIALRWWRRFLAFRPWLLATALFFLSASVALDLFDEPLYHKLGHWQYFWEDGAKFLGICLWATYFIGSSHRAVVRT
jgi:hypothetical protein